MLKVYPEQLQTQLNEGLCAVYLLLGNDPLLLQESRDIILKIATTKGFDEHHIVQIDNNTDWKIIFSFFQERSLLSFRQTLTLSLPKNGPNAVINKHLATIVSFLHRNLLLIVCGNKLTKIQEKATWFTQLSTKAVFVSCQTPEQVQLPKWVAERARLHNLQLDESSCQLLCSSYEGNLLALAQALDRLSLLWPNVKLTLPLVRQAVNNLAHFTSFHWIDALLSAKSKRALHILHQLYLEGIAPVILLRSLQRELLLLITLKRHEATFPLRVLYDKFHVWNNRRIIITNAINRLSHDQLRKVVHLLARAELTLKQDHDQLVWEKLENISLLLCSKELADIFIND